jgi:AraC-like DNA-binding protein
MTYLIRSQALQGYFPLVRELGGDPTALLERFQIAPALLDDPDAFLPFRSLNNLLEASATTLGCPDFGLRLSDRQGLEILGPIAVIARHEGSFAQAIQAIARYLHLHSPALRLTIGAPEGNVVKLRYEVVEPRLAQTRQVSEQSMGVGRQIVKLLAGPAARPAAVFFPHEPLREERFYRDFFGCRVLFGQPTSGLVLTFELLARPIAAADSGAHRLAEQYLESLAASGTESITEHVARLIRRLLPTGQCSVDTVANHLCFSVRTLQRRLGEEDWTFNALVERERQALAARYLTESRLPMSQITGLLGYTEQSTFIHACRRWFGVAPRMFRAGQLQEG